MGETNDPIESLLVREDPKFSDLVAEFVDGLAERIADMEQAMRAADFEQLRTCAHRLIDRRGHVQQRRFRGGDWL